MNSLITLVLLVAAAFSDTMSQADWSGGCGVLGPTSEWGDTFWDSDASVEFSGGNLELISNPSPYEYLVEGDFDHVNSLYTIDIDGDGDEDILGGASADGVVWWENSDTSPGLIWTEHVIDNSFNYCFNVFSSDMDGDGDADVLGAAGWNADNINWWENIDGTGTTWAEHQIGGGFEVAYSVFSNDLDGDGDADVVGAFHYDGILWYENADGKGTVWVEHTLDESFYSAMEVYSDDMDDDGDADVLGASRIGDGEIAWWENTDGTGTLWEKHSIRIDFFGARAVSAIDIDGDGDKDVLGVGSYLDTIAWWENVDGSSENWVEHIVDSNFTDAWFASSSDVDGDGDMDILGASDTYSSGSIIWWENADGTGLNLIEHIVDGNLDGGRYASSIDINSDGISDILGAANGSDDILWWDLSNFVPTGSLESSILTVGQVGEWGTFTSSLVEPPGTSVSFQFRSSRHYSNMGAWSDTIYSNEASLVYILSDSTSYLQYKVILETEFPSITPELYELVVSYFQLGIDEDHSDSWFMQASENPSIGALSVLLSVPEDTCVEIFLYDVSGRVVNNLSDILPTGTHTVNFAGLAEGVYFCKMDAGEFSATERVVVLD